VQREAAFVGAKTLGLRLQVRLCVHGDVIFGAGEALMVIEVFTIAGHAWACMLIEVFSLTWGAFVSTEVRFGACFACVGREVLFCAGGALVIIEVLSPTGLTGMVAQMFEFTWFTLVFVEVCLITGGWGVILCARFTGVGRQRSYESFLGDREAKFDLSFGVKVRDRDV